MQQRFQFPISQQYKQCQICQQKAQFFCSRCRQAFYCSAQHQKQDWSKHKLNCKKIQKVKQNIVSESISSIRNRIRKNIFQSYAVQKYEDCLTLLKILEEQEVKNLKKSNDTNDQYEYGATICLIVRILTLLNELDSAKLKLQQYITNNTIIYDHSKLPIRGKPMTPSINTFFLKKLSLISNLANLSYSLSFPCISLYILYSDCIQIVFGQNSIELSNCYFLIGCYYAQEGYPLKALACFNRAAQIRGDQAADCYFNMGVLYKWIQKNNKSIQMFDKALQKRQEQFGKISVQVAEVLQNLGIIYMDEFDYKTSISKFQEAYNIRRLGNLQHPDFIHLSQLIIIFYKKLIAYIHSGTINIQKQQIYTHLKETVKDNQIWLPQMKNTLNNIYLQKKIEHIPQQWRQSFINRRDKMKFKFNPDKFMRLGFVEDFLKKQDDLKKVQVLQKQIANNQQKHSVIQQKIDYYNIQINNQILSKLSSFQTYHLAQLQMQLQSCHSRQLALETILGSKLFKGLDNSTAQLLIEANKQLFKSKNEIIRNKKPSIKVPRLDYNKAKV